MGSWAGVTRGAKLAMVGLLVYLVQVTKGNVSQQLVLACPPVHAALPCLPPQSWSVAFTGTLQRATRAMAAQCLACHVMPNNDHDGGDSVLESTFLTAQCSVGAGDLRGEAQLGVARWPGLGSLSLAYWSPATCCKVLVRICSTAWRRGFPETG